MLPALSSMPFFAPQGPVLHQPEHLLPVAKAALLRLPKPAPSTAALRQAEPPDPAETLPLSQPHKPVAPAPALVAQKLRWCRTYPGQAEPHAPHSFVQTEYTAPQLPRDPIESAGPDNDCHSCLCLESPSAHPSQDLPTRAARTKDHPYRTQSV